MYSFHLEATKLHRIIMAREADIAIFPVKSSRHMVHFAAIKSVKLYVKNTCAIEFHN